MAYVRIPSSNLKRKKVLDQGGFGIVYKARLSEGESNQEVAAKLVVKEEGLREVDFLSKLHHQNIVKLLGVVDDDVDFFIVLELCEGGLLRSYLNAHRGRRLGGRFYDWAKQAGRPIAYLKTKGVTHKDIKSPNYLITGGKILKLCDFGLAKDLGATMSKATETASYPWMAPKLLKDNILSPSYDIFAYGVVVWELWTTDIPFEDCKVPANLVWRICERNERPPIPADCPKAVADLLRQCWEVDWKRRSSMEHLLSKVESAEILVFQKTFIDGPWELDSEFGHQDGPGKLDGARDIAVCPNRDIAVVENLGDKVESADMLAFQKTFIDCSWELESEFGHQDGPGRLGSAWCIVVCPNGDIAVMDLQEKTVYVYSNETYKFRLDLKQGMDPGIVPLPLNVTVNADGIFFVTCNCYVLMYAATGEYKGRWVAMSPDNKPSDTVETWLDGLTIDNNGHLLVGQVNSPCKYISKHRQDGSHIGSIKVNTAPMYLAATSHDTIVISEWRSNTVQIVDSTGHVLHTLNPNRQVSFWWPRGVCCHNDIILVCNYHEISCFSVSAEYVGSIRVRESPMSVTIANDSKLLVACQNKVLVYKK